MDAQRRVRELMEERSWTDYRLAKKSNLSHSTLRHFHSRPVPTCRKTKNPGTRTCLLTNPNSRKYLVFYTFSVRLRHAESPYSPLTEYVPSEQAHGHNLSAVLHGSLLTRDINTTLSTCPVWQNISTVCIFPVVYPLSANILISLANVAGSQET